MRDKISKKSILFVALAFLVITLASNAKAIVDGVFFIANTVSNPVITTGVKSAPVTLFSAIQSTYSSQAKASVISMANYRGGALHVNIPTATGASWRIGLRSSPTGLANTWGTISVTGTVTGA